MTHQIGEIRYCRDYSDNKGWFIVERTSNTPSRYPAGGCFYGYWLCEEEPLGGWNLESCTVVPDEDVTDELWAALAKWRLIGADPA